MNTSIQFPEPNGIVQPSGNSSQSETALSALRSPGAPFLWVALLTGLLFLLSSAPAARADRNPAGCLGSGLGISLFTSLPDVHIGDTISYSITVFNQPFPACDAGETNPATAGAIKAFVVTPDGVTNNITLRRTFLAPGDSDSYPNVVSYVVRAQDIRPDGTIRATAIDQGDIHQNDVNSSGGGNQGVNTQVNLPCVAIAAQCVGSVGENGVITFTGTVTNCGNNTLVGVTVTNFNDNGFFTVLFPTNLAIGQVTSFSGSWVPANPCGPNTATLTVLATDQFTSTPRTVTSFTTVTCQNALTPGIKVTKVCPAQPVSPGQLLTFSGSVSNTGNVTLTNIVVVDSQPVANTTVFTRPTLAPGAVANFTGSYTAPTNCSVADTLTATAASRCGVAVSSIASATCPILTTPQIAVAVFCPVTPSVAGGTLTYSGNVRNAGDTSLTNIVVASDRPAPNTTVFTVATLAPGASANFTSSLTVPADACSVTTTFSGRGQDICTPNMVTNTVPITCPITTAPAIAVTLACPATPVATGGLITYTGTVRNSGNVTLNNVAVVNSQASPSTVLNVPSLAPGASANFTASFTAPADTCSVSSMVTASGSDSCTQAVVNNSASATCALVTTPRIAVTQSCPANPISLGGVLSYSGSVSNAGNITLTNVIVTDDRTGASPVFTVATLAPGASTNFTGSYTVPVNSGCAITSTLTANGRDQCTGTLVTANAAATCQVVGAPNIAVTLACPATATPLGGLLTFSGTISNSGTVTLTNVVVIRNAPAPNTTVFSAASLAAGASANFSGSYTVPGSDACSITTSVGASANDQCAGSGVNARASISCPLVTTPRIVVTQDCSTNPVSSGGVLTYSGTVCNGGNITLTNIVVSNNQTAAPIITTNNTAIVTTNTPGTITTNTTVTVTTNAATPVSFGTIDSHSQLAVDRFVISNDFKGLTYAGEDHGYGATEFYSMHKATTGTSFFDTIIASTATTTDRFDASSRNFDALAYAAPDVGYGPVIFYYLSHDNAGVSTFGSITPGGTVGVTADHFVAGTNFDALTFTATDVGYGANLFYYVRHDATGLSTFGTINPALPGTITDRFAVGTNVDALVFTDLSAPGYGANNFYYLRHDANGVSTFGTIFVTGQNTATVTDRFPVGTNATELTFTATDAGSFGPNLFYFLRGRGLGFTTNSLTTYTTNTTITFTTNIVTTYTTNTMPPITVPSLAPGACTNFTGSYLVPGTNVCSVTAIVTATASDICSGNTVSNTIMATCPLTTAPRIAVTLNCPVVHAAFGGLVTYTGTVSNPGNVTLNNVAVVDNQASPSTVLTLPSLAPGASAIFTASFTAPTNACSVSSTVTASGSDACSGTMVNANALATCPLTAAPTIAVTLACPATPVATGSLITYSGTVRNSGNVTLNNVTVVNSQAGTVLTVPSLAPGVTDNFTASFTAPTDACSVSSTVTVSGNDACSATVVTDSKSATCPLVTAPRITITQNCPEAPMSPGGLVTYIGSVSNAGNITLSNVVVTSGGSGTTPSNITNTTFWVDDAVPAGAEFTSFGGDSWNWISSNPSPFSGTKAHQSYTERAMHKHAFEDATDTFPINVGDILVAYVYLDPDRVPSEVMLEWSDNSFEHRAFWGDNLINFGTEGTASRRYMGPLPAAGQWVRLEVPASMVGLEGHSLTGMAFTLYGGRATWDAAGKATQTIPPPPSEGTVVFTAATLAPGAVADFTVSYTVPTNSGCSFTSTLTARAGDTCTGTLVTANVSATCPLVTIPAIAVTQICPTTPVLQGGILTYSGTVSNAGNITLTNIIVVNNRPADNTVIFTAVSLAPGATAQFTGSYEVPINCCVLWSTATASGHDSCVGTTVTDTDTTTCTVLTTPRIVVTKVCPPTAVQSGDVLQYSGTVSNAGNITLVQVTIVNTQPSAGSPIFGPITLAPGEAVSYYASYLALPDFCGTDTVTAQGLDVCTFAPAVNSVTTTCPVITTPRIAVTKNCPSETTPRGGVFTFTGTVSNPGNVTLTNVVVANNYQVDCYSRTNGPVIGPITLAPGAFVNFSGSYTAPWSCCAVMDTLTASGQGLCSGTRVTATASQVCPLLSTPRITVTRVCPAAPVPVGGVFAYSGSVSNAGDVVLTNVSVLSSKPNANTPVLGPIALAPGETQMFSGSYTVTTGSDPATDTVTARGTDDCQGRTVTATANCSGSVGPLAISLVTVANGTATVTWAATPGVTYRLQCASNNQNSVWINVSGDVTASANTASKNDAVGSAKQRFYRIMVVQ
jgi:uncharacterized repeat protein (TIGR01451 family)